MKLNVLSTLVLLFLIGNIHSQNMGEIAAKWDDGEHTKYTVSNNMVMKFKSIDIKFEKDNDGIVKTITLPNGVFKAERFSGGDDVISYEGKYQVMLHVTETSIIKYKYQGKEIQILEMYGDKYGGVKKCSKDIHAFRVDALAKSNAANDKRLADYREKAERSTITGHKIKKFEVELISDDSKIDCGSIIKVGYTVTRDDGVVIKSETLGGDARPGEYSVKIKGCRQMEGKSSGGGYSYKVMDYCESFDDKKLVITAMPKNHEEHKKIITIETSCVPDPRIIAKKKKAEEDKKKAALLAIENEKKQKELAAKKKTTPETGSKQGPTVTSGSKTKTENSVNNVGIQIKKAGVKNGFYDFPYPTGKSREYYGAEYDLKKELEAMPGNHELKSLVYSDGLYIGSGYTYRGLSKDVNVEVCIYKPSSNTLEIYEVSSEDSYKKTCLTVAKNGDVVLGYERITDDSPEESLTNLVRFDPKKSLDEGSIHKIWQKELSFSKDYKITSMIENSDGDFMSVFKTTDKQKSFGDSKNTVYKYVGIGLVLIDKNGENPKSHVFETLKIPSWGRSSDGGKIEMRNQSEIRFSASNDPIILESPNSEGYIFCARMQFGVWKYHTNMSWNNTGTDVFTHIEDNKYSMLADQPTFVFINKNTLKPSSFDFIETTYDTQKGRNATHLHANNTLGYKYKINEFWHNSDDNRFLIAEYDWAKKETMYWSFKIKTIDNWSGKNVASTQTVGGNKPKSDGSSNKSTSTKVEITYTGRGLIKFGDDRNTWGSQVGHDQTETLDCDDDIYLYRDGKRVKLVYRGGSNCGGSIEVQ